MGDDVATLDKEFAVERDADGASRGLTLIDRRHRPALDAPDLRELALGHDHDLVAGGEMAGFDAACDDAAIVELVDRLYRQPQRQLCQRPRRFEAIDPLDYGRTAVPLGPRRAFGHAVTVARRNRNHRRGRDAKTGQMRGNLGA